MIDVKMVLKGERALQKTMDDFKQSVQGTMTKQVTAAMAKPIIKEARKRAPKQSKLLRKSLGVKVWYAKKTGVYLAFIGPRRKMGGEYEGRRRLPTRYAHLTERGYTLRSGVHSPAKPWLRPALVSQKSAALQAGKEKLRAVLAKKVAAMAAKAAKKAGK